MAISIKVARESFKELQSKELNFSDEFYKNLFEKYPESKILFHEVNDDKQRQLFLNSIDFILSNLENEERLAEYIQNLGHRHLSYGADEIHFDWVEDALMATLTSVLGDSWTPEIKDCWSDLFATIKGYMLQGMRRDTPSPLGETNVVDIRANVDSQDLSLPDSVRVHIRDLVKRNVHEMIKQEIHNVVQEELSNISDETIIEILSTLKVA